MRAWSAGIAVGVGALVGVQMSRAGSAASLRERVGATTRQPFEDQYLSRDLEAARAVLSDRFDDRYAEGAALDAHAAVALALGE